MHGDVNNFFVSATSNMFEGAFIKRDLCYENGVLRIRDSLSSEFKEKWRLQYVLHPDVSVRYMEESDEVVLNNKGVKIILRLAVEDSSFFFNIEDANYSERFMASVKTKKLVLSGFSDKVSIETFLHHGLVF